MTDTHQVGAGREMDALVAEKVMGIRQEVRLAGTTERATVYSDNPWWQDGYQTLLDVHRHGGPLPYSTDIAAAWEVFYAPRLLDAGWLPFLDTDPLREAGFVRTVGFGHAVYDAVIGYADRLEEVPLAICRAALTAVEKP